MLIAPAIGPARSIAVAVADTSVSIDAAFDEIASGEAFVGFNGIVVADTAATAVEAAVDAVVEETYVIDVGPLIDWGLLFVIVVGPAGIYYVAVRYLKVKAVADNREIVMAALEKAVAFGVAKARGRLLDLGKIETRNEVVAAASSYAISAIPDALTKLGIGADGLRDRLIARAEEYLRYEGTPVGEAPSDTVTG